MSGQLQQKADLPPHFGEVSHVVTRLDSARPSSVAILRIHPQPGDSGSGDHFQESDTAVTRTAEARLITMSTPAAPAEASPDPNGSNQSLDAISTRSFDSSLSSRSEGRRISFIGDDLRRKSVQSDSQIATETVVGNSGRQTPIQEGKLARRTLSPPPER